VICLSRALVIKRSLIISVAIFLVNSRTGPKTDPARRFPAEISSMPRLPGFFDIGTAGFFLSCGRFVFFGNVRPIFGLEDIALNMFGYRTEIFKKVLSVTVIGYEGIAFDMGKILVYQPRYRIPRTTFPFTRETLDAARFANV